METKCKLFAELCCMTCCVNLKALSVVDVVAVVVVASANRRFDSIKLGFHSESVCLSVRLLVCVCRARSFIRMLQPAALPSPLGVRATSTGEQWPSTFAAYLSANRAFPPYSVVTVSVSVSIAVATPRKRHGEQ